MAGMDRAWVVCRGDAKAHGQHYKAGSAGPLGAAVTTVGPALKTTTEVATAELPWPYSLC